MLINNDKIMVAMSGGVDSTVSSLILKNIYQNTKKIAGATMKLCDKQNVFQDIKEVMSICDKLSIKYFTLDLKNEFKKFVINNFIDEYINGNTPNPCIICNKLIKFNIFKIIAKKLGYNKIATGHYCRIKKDQDRYFLLKAKDLTKDQSYFLYSLKQNTLSNIIFPIGELTKKEVRQIAKDNNLINANKKDSQDICFISKKQTYIDLIKNHCKEKNYNGNIINLDGKIIGKHNGLFNYTIGQKKRLDINTNEKTYVIKKDINKNILIVGENKFLFTNKLIAYDVNFIAFDLLKSSMIVWAKIRASHKEAKAKIFPLNQNKIYVEFFESQRGITSGQSIVFYDNDYVLGGGIISIV